MTELTIEYAIQRELSLEEQGVALEFVCFLKENHLSFTKITVPIGKIKYIIG